MNKANDQVEPKWWRELLEVQSVVDARKALINVIKHHVKSGDFQIEGYHSENRAKSEIYKFDKSGNRKESKFGLWQIRNGRIFVK